MACKTSNFPNGIKVGKCLELVDGATVVIAQNIVEVDSGDSPYPMTGDEDIILCTGSVTINFISVADSMKEVTIQADGATVNLNSSDDIQNGTSNIVDGNSIRLVGKKSANEWRIL